MWEDGEVLTLTSYPIYCKRARSISLKTSSSVQSSKTSLCAAGSMTLSNWNNVSRSSLAPRYFQNRLANTLLGR